jgi:hypothetical protein
VQKLPLSSATGSSPSGNSLHQTVYNYALSGQYEIQISSCKFRRSLEGFPRQADVEAVARRLSSAASALAEWTTRCSSTRARPEAVSSNTTFPFSRISMRIHPRFKHHPTGPETGGRRFPASRLGVQFYFAGVAVSVDSSSSCKVAANAQNDLARIKARKQTSMLASLGPRTTELPFDRALWAGRATWRAARIKVSVEVCKRLVRPGSVQTRLVERLSHPHCTIHRS